MKNSDLKILTKIFFPTNASDFILNKNEIYHVDKNGKTSTIISTDKKKSATNLNRFEFDFINNPDGTIRWTYPSHINQPVFLKLYNSSGWRGFIFKLIFKIAFILGLKKWIKSGSFSVFTENEKLFKNLFQQFPTKEYAIFTGTIGDNRKAVMALKGATKNDSFYKIPLTQSAEQLVKKEGNILQKLNTYSFNQVEVPNASFIQNGLLQSDVRPDSFSNASDLQPLHFQFIKEMTNNTHQSILLKKIPTWNEITDCLYYIGRQKPVNNLPEKKVDNIIDHLMYLYNSFDPYLIYHTATAHGDFTPWNMYIGKEKIHVYDWELSGRMPLLFDVFHFIFQSNILIKRKTYEEFEQEITSLKNNSIIKEILKNQTIKFEKLYQFYLLKNISYYLSKYMQQETLHEQAYWLLDAWEAALATQREVQELVA